MKIAAVYCVFDEPDYLDISVIAVQNHLDKVLFLVSQKMQSGAEFDNSKTVARIEAICAENSKFEMLQGTWPCEAEQRNFGLAHLQKEGFDYAFQINADEIYHPFQVKNIRDFVASQPQVAAFYVAMNAYWGKDYHVIEAGAAMQPLAVVKIKNFVFTAARSGSSAVVRTGDQINKIEAEGLALLIPPHVALGYDLSFARDDAYIQRVIASFESTPDSLKNWYETVWLKWKLGDENLHPITPHLFKKAIPSDFASFPFQLQLFIKLEKYQKRQCVLAIAHEDKTLDVSAFIAKIKQQVTHANLKIVLLNFTQDQSLAVKIKNEDINIIEAGSLPKAQAFNQALKIGESKADLCLIGSSLNTEGDWLSALYQSVLGVGPAGLAGLPQTVSGLSAEDLKEDQPQAHLSHQCMLILKEVVGKIGGFDTHFLDDLIIDADFCIRARMAGFSLLGSVACKAQSLQESFIDLKKIPLQEALQNKFFFQKYHQLLLIYSSQINLFSNSKMAQQLGLIC